MGIKAQRAAAPPKAHKPLPIAALRVALWLAVLGAWAGVVGGKLRIPCWGHPHCRF